MTIVLRVDPCELDDVIGNIAANAARYPGSETVAVDSGKYRLTLGAQWRTQRSAQCLAAFAEFADVVAPGAARLTKHNRPDGGPRG